MSAFRLLVTEPGEPEAATFLLTGQELVVGRDDAADLFVAESSVSTRHGRFSPTARGYAYTDLGSTNGSALVREGGAPTPCPGHAPIPLSDGDVLLIGDAERAVTIRVEAMRAVAAAPSPARTVIARAPLVDLLAVGATADTSDLSRLAARVMVAGAADALAGDALDYLAALVPQAALRGVTLWGPGLAATRGDAIPRGLVETAMAGDGLAQAELLTDSSSTPLPQTGSLVAHGTRAALVIPVAVSGVSWGLLYAASPLGPAAFPPHAVEHAAIAGPLIALGASELSRRLASDARAAALATENDRLQRGSEPDPIGRAKAFVEVVRMARQVAATDVPLLVQGETGTGKEVLARFVHRSSLRAGKPFVAFNCAAIPENLIESELFGHQRGAFTGATQDKKGLFEEAHGGTLFLDEIGEMPPLMQAKLLRVLQDGEIRRVGANKPAHVDVRVVSATHRDLGRMVADGKFRADLMFRLNAVTLKLPPLRERGDDIALIAHVLLSRAAAQCRKRFPGFAPDALWALSTYAFPGNIRELDNEILRAAALTPDGEAIRASAFSDALQHGVPAPLASPTSVLPLKDAVARAERLAIEAALAHTAGNVTEAARLLGVTRPGLYKAMERLDLR